MSDDDALEAILLAAFNNESDPAPDIVEEPLPAPTPTDGVLGHYEEPGTSADVVEERTTLPTPTTQAPSSSNESAGRTDAREDAILLTSFNADKSKQCAYESDEPILHSDPYFEKGCERRMIFRSSPIPEELRYKGAQLGDEIFINSTARSNAVNKFFNWCRSRTTASKSEDGRMPRHFVLKMGVPEGAYGEPSRLAMQVDSVFKQFLRTRLRKSHITIETEIPFHKLAATGYFKDYMDTIVSLTDKTKLGSRLMIELEDTSTQKLLQADPTVFYNEPIDIDATWQRLIDAPDAYRAIHAFNNISHTECPTQEEMDSARKVFVQRKQDQMGQEKLNVDLALAHTKDFISTILCYGQVKDPIRAAVLKATEALTPGSDVHVQTHSPGSEQAPCDLDNYNNTLAQHDYSLINQPQQREKVLLAAVTPRTMCFARQASSDDVQPQSPWYDNMAPSINLAGGHSKRRHDSDGTQLESPKRSKISPEI